MSGLKRRTDILLVCSCGGHLLELLNLNGAWVDLDHAWVTFDKSDSRSLLKGERVIHAFGPTNRNVPNLARNLILAWRVIAATRPRVVVTTGAGVAVPFIWVARLRGARVVFVESFTRIDTPSLTLRLVRPAVERIYVQWPELSTDSPKNRYAGSVFGGALLILVTVGTNERPFDRLIQVIDELEWEEPVFVQHGSSRAPRPPVDGAPYLEFDELVELVEQARIVVSHAGVGSVALALRAGRRPIVVPRRRAAGDAVDDHQVPFAQRMASAGLAVVAENASELREAVRRAGPPRTTGKTRPSRL